MQVEGCRAYTADDCVDCAAGWEGEGFLHGEGVADVALDYCQVAGLEGGVDAFGG